MDKPSRRLSNPWRKTPAHKARLAAAHAVYRARVRRALELLERYEREGFLIADRADQGVRA